MPKFEIGATVVFAKDNVLVPRDFSGRMGTVTEVLADLQVQNTPADPWVPTYMVRFDGEQEAMLVEEDWLEMG